MTSWKELWRVSQRLQELRRAPERSREPQRDLQFPGEPGVQLASGYSRQLQRAREGGECSGQLSRPWESSGEPRSTSKSSGEASS
eukprot:10185098-Alexandrium_andersonii.AAC.1